MIVGEEVAEAFALLMIPLTSSMEIGDTSKSHFGGLGEGIHDVGLGEGIHDGGLGEGIHDGGLGEGIHDGCLNDIIGWELYTDLKYWKA